MALKIIDPILVVCPVMRTCSRIRSSQTKLSRTGFDHVVHWQFRICENCRIIP